MNLAELSNKYGKYKVIPLLLSIFLLGFSIRYLAAGPRIGPELDTWFHYRMVNYFFDLGYVPQNDPLSYYPTGRPVWETDLLGLPYFIGYTYKFVGLFGMTLMDYMVAFPAIFTSLAAVPFYLLTKELINRKTGLLAALFWQIIPSTLTRTHAGFVDKETLSSIYIFLWLWLFIKSIKTFDLKDRKTLPAPVLAGIFMGLSAWTWGGTRYFVLVISASILLHALLSPRELNESLGFSLILMTVFGAATMIALQAPRFPLHTFYTSFIYMPLTSLSLIFGLWIFYRHLFGGAGLSGIPQRFISSVLGFVRSKIFLEKSLIGATVSENLAPKFFCGGESVIHSIIRCDWYSHFNAVLFVAPLGFFLLLLRYKQKIDYSSLFIMVFAISGILGMRSDIRLSFVLTPAFSVLTAYAILHFAYLFQKKEIELKKILAHSKKKKVRYKAETQISNIKVAKLLVIVIIFGVVASPAVASFSMLNGRKVDVPTPWYDAMIWLKENTPENAVIVSWWDYGYWEQALAKRISVVDGGNAGPLVYNTNFTEGLEYRGSTEHRDRDMAKMFTSTEDEALKYLRPYVDYERVPTYLIVSWEEFGKSGAINHISLCNCLYIFPQTFPRSDDPSVDEKLINDFINNNGIESFSSIVNYQSYWQIWFTGFDPNKGMMPDPEMKNRLLPKLLPLSRGYGQGLEHFELVYQDEWNYVLIYKVK